MKNKINHKKHFINLILSNLKAKVFKNYKTTKNNLITNFVLKSGFTIDLIFKRNNLIYTENFLLNVSVYDKIIDIVTQLYLTKKNTQNIIGYFNHEPKICFVHKDYVELEVNNLICEYDFKNQD